MNNSIVIFLICFAAKRVVNKIGKQPPTIQVAQTKGL